MYVFKLGEPYPVHNEANGQEKARADLTTAFFNVCYYLNGAKASDVALWQGPFDYAVCEVAPGIPFVLASLAGGRWLFDVSLNWRTMRSPAEREAWAEHHDPTLMSFALIDAHTNRLLAYRLFAPAPPFVDQLRTIARRQLASFPDHQAVEQAITEAERIPLVQLRQRATFYRIP